MAEALFVVGLMGTAFSTLQQIEAAKDAERIADRNAERAEKEAEERARRLAKEKARELSMGRARAAASGFRMGDSSQIYLDELERTRDEEIRWVREAGASQADILREEGDYARTQGFGSAFGTLASGAANAYSWYDSYIQ